MCVCVCVCVCMCVCVCVSEGERACLYACQTGVNLSAIVITHARVHASWQRLLGGVPVCVRGVCVFGGARACHVYTGHMYDVVAVSTNK